MVSQACPKSNNSTYFEPTNIRHKYVCPGSSRYSRRRPHRVVDISTEKDVYHAVTWFWRSVFCRSLVWLCRSLVWLGVQISVMVVPWLDILWSGSAVAWRSVAWFSVAWRGIICRGMAWHSVLCITIMVRAYEFIFYAFTCTALV